MAIRRAQKESWVEDFRRDLGTAAFVVVTKPKGLAAGETAELRRAVRAESAKFRIVRNRLARRALAETQNAALLDLLQGEERGVAFSDDGIAVAKVCNDFAKDLEERFVIVGGLLDGAPLDAPQVTALAKLPSLDVLRAQIIGVLQAPASKLARTLNEPAAALARLSNARATQGE